MTSRQEPGGTAPADQIGFTVWLTGLSGSGKSTVAGLVVDELRRRRSRVELLTGSDFRQSVSQGLGFTREDRAANIRRIGYVAHLLTRNGVAVVADTISPNREVRDECREHIHNFVEVFVDCPLEECEKRDRAGLYRRARLGELDDFPGVNGAYEPPLNPEVVVRTAVESPEQAADRVIEALVGMGYLGRNVPVPADPDERLIRERLRALERR